VKSHFAGALSICCRFSFFLDHVTGAVAVSQNSSGVLQEWPFKAPEERVHLLAVHFSRLSSDALHFPFIELTREAAEN
jgi:hypothetical protein